MSSQKGSVLLIVVSFTALIAIVAAGYFYYQNQHLRQKSNVSNQELKKPVTSVTLTPTSTETANWKTYDNKEFHFLMKYPSQTFLYTDPSISDLFVATSIPKGGNGPKFLNSNDLWLEAHVNKMVGFSSISDLDSFVKSNPGLSTASKQYITIGESPAYKLTYSQQVAAAGNTSVTEYVEESMVVHDYTLFIITLSSWNKDILNQNTALFDQILSTFKFT